MSEPRPCPKGDAGCGEMHPGCIGHNRAGKPCRAQPMNGTGPDRPRCRSHLGRRPDDVRAEYEVARIAQARYEQAQQAARAHGAAGDIIDPLQALLDLAGEALAWKEVCKTMVGGLDEVRYKSSSSGEQLRAEVGLWERSMDRAGRILVDIARLGGAEWLTRLSDDQSSRIAGAVDAAIDEVGRALGVSTNDIDVRRIVAAHIREVSRP